MIERFYDPNGGEILIDGQNLKGIHLRDFRQKVGYVGQEPILFNTTIEENVKLGNPSATEQEI